MSEALDRLAALAGILPTFRDYYGNETVVSNETKVALLHAMGYDVASERRIRSSLREAERELADAVPQAALDTAPPQCFVPPEMESGNTWALATQLYALRSERNWGIGDFGDLREFVGLASRAGAGAVALNPLHELFPSNPRASSPYAPSSRLFLNIFYIDVTAVPDFAESPHARARVAEPEFAAALQGLRTAALVDYEGVANVKLGVLRLLWESFRTNQLERPGGARPSDFRTFVRAGGDELERLARYEALAEHFRALDAGCYGWLQWPAEYRSPDSSAVERFAREQRARVDFYLYAQWVADRQLARAAASAGKRGAGLYRDLAVGVDRNGADAWSDPGAVAAEASLGAPADPLNVHGQNWGLPPLSPRALRERAYAPFASLLRANMRYAEILRVDHVMALQRAFWIPQGQPASEGAYVRYPLEEMLGVARARKRAQRVRGRRRRSRHGARRLSRTPAVGARAVVAPRVLRAHVGRRVSTACRVSAVSGGERRHARPAAAARMVDGRRQRRAPARSIHACRRARARRLHRRGLGDAPSRGCRRGWNGRRRGHAFRGRAPLSRTNALDA